MIFAVAHVSKNSGSFGAVSTILLLRRRDYQTNTKWLGLAQEIQSHKCLYVMMTQERINGTCATRIELPSWANYPEDIASADLVATLDRTPYPAAKGAEYPRHRRIFRVHVITVSVRAWGLCSSGPGPIILRIGIIKFPILKKEK